ncbi:hypothetical protein [Aeromicrobium sp.]|uniref:hypothetical protein n=1 Tax=Aeromicrobium sp. TaxID=1871063 RepID=UPI002FC75DF7
MPDYFTLAELRALPDVDNVTKYPEARCEAAADHIVAIFEREVGTSFITRMVVDEAYDGGTNWIPLRRSYVQAIVSATEDGAVVTDDLIVRGGVLLRLSGGSPVTWATGYSNVVVTYEYGYSTAPPADVKEMALKGTRAHLMATAADSSANARRTSLSTEMGVESFVVAGQNRPTGYPEVDATILGYKAMLNIGSFA